jgi:hypothetical protein
MMLNMPVNYQPRKIPALLWMQKEYYLMILKTIHEKVHFRNK